MLGYSMAYQYVLRLQEHKGYSDSFDVVFGVRFDRVLCVRHTGKTGENPHFHFVFKTDYKDSALRKYLKGHFNQGKGNGHMSLKEWDGRDDAVSYMFHEGGDPILNKGWEDDEIRRLREKDKVIRSEMVDPKGVCDIIAEVMKVEYERLSDQQDRKNIFTQLFYYYKKRGDWFPNKFQCERYINKIRMLVTPDRNDGWLINLMYNEYFRD